jgi:serine/threonine protein kinase
VDRPVQYHSVERLLRTQRKRLEPPSTRSYQMVDDWSQAIQHDVMRVYRAKRDEAHRSVTLKYTILGFISSGTYGRVYKAQSKDEDGKLHAIKKFKPDKDGDVATYTGISQSAIREIAVRLSRMYRSRGSLNMA